MTNKDTSLQGWQYKWETVLRPKSAPPDTRRVRECKSPANIFQNCDKVKKDSKWKLLKAKFQNRFKNKIEHIDDNKTEPELAKMSAEEEQKSIDVTETMESSTCEGGMESKENNPTETENVTLVDEAETAVQNKRKSRTRKDSLELLRENVNRLHSADTADITTDISVNNVVASQDSTRSVSESTNSLIDEVQCDIRLSVDDVGAMKEVDKIADEPCAISDSIEKSADSGTVNTKEAEKIIDVVNHFRNLIKKPKDVSMIKEKQFDTVSIHTELFYPDEWIYESCIGLNELWDLCGKTTASMRRREYKQYMKYTVEEESILKKDKRKRERYTFKVLDEQRTDSAK
ncbi:hypothetical protein ACF0H5_011136 [Mactra antiquata]